LGMPLFWTILSEKIRLISIYWFMVILPARLEDKALLERNLSARWGSRRMGRTELLTLVFLPPRSF
jgi:hypothetical protein